MAMRWNHTDGTFHSLLLSAYVYWRHLWQDDDRWLYFLLTVEIVYVLDYTLHHHYRMITCNGVFVGVCVCACVYHASHFYLLFRNGMIVRVQSSEGEGKLPPNTPTSSQKILKTIYGCMFDFIYVSDCIKNVNVCPCIYLYFILSISSALFTLQATIAAVEDWEHIVLPTGSVFQKQG